MPTSLNFRFFQLLGWLFAWARRNAQAHTPQITATNAREEAITNASAACAFAQKATDHFQDKKDGIEDT